MMGERVATYAVLMAINAVVLFVSYYWGGFELAVIVGMVNLLTKIDQLNEKKI